MEITQSREYQELRDLGATHEEALEQIAIWNS